ncbi:MAG: acyl-CoA thioesterase [Granulosicoccus sp.]
MVNPEGRFLHQVQFPVRWGDMDALGHINNIVYFQYFEIVRLQWYEQAGFLPLGSSTEGTVIVDNHALYLKPVVYPAFITVRMGGHSPGRSSFISTYTLTIEDELYTSGSAKVVWIDTTTGKSVPLPDAVRASLT